MRLKQLEAQKINTAPQQTQLTLKAPIEPLKPMLKPSSIITELQKIVPENLTPRQALEVIYRLYGMLMSNVRSSANGNMRPLSP
ncbi:MAG: hypothetical protein R3E08_05305 [Thiotrichaceae bacterium]